ncbi:uncharacterized protein LOC135080432 isoform X2 [Ostrinia nubilalis]|uniref:uncharacterized protein LOC135080432 isoform X2 n=1 Tax=Ostrinia nubilalis TaxID=29057 RepID=UPI003082640F
MLLSQIFAVIIWCRSAYAAEDTSQCRIPPWQHLPVELDQHLNSMRERFGNTTAARRQIKGSQLAMVHSGISRYMDTVLAPFLDTYLRNIQSSYQQMTSKILRRIKEEINNAVQKKLQVYNELLQLADKLNVPAMCDEERRQARTIASKHVALIYSCTEDARASIAKMGKYAEEMITITKKHMNSALDDAAKVLELSVRRSKDTHESDVTACLKRLSRSAVTLGYELDLSLTNARRHNEQSHEKLTACSTKSKRDTEDAVSDLRDQLYQCVYA